MYFFAGTNRYMKSRIRCNLRFNYVPHRQHTILNNNLLIVDCRLVDVVIDCFVAQLASVDCDLYKQCPRSRVHSCVQDALILSTRVFGCRTYRFNLISTFSTTSTTAAVTTIRVQRVAVDTNGAIGTAFGGRWSWSRQ